MSLSCGIITVAVEPELFQLLVVCLFGLLKYTEVRWCDLVEIQHFYFEKS